MGYGISATMLICIFISTFFRPRWKLIMVGVLVGFLGLSLYVSYMQQRTEFRSHVWGSESGLARKISQFSKIITTTVPFNIFNIEHLEWVDIRLNQNYLVGKSVDNIKNNIYVDFARGETFKNSFIGLIIIY